MDTLPFETIGRFQIDAAIGQGGMGVVYRANDPILQRPVAIKLLAPHLGQDPNASARFQREASLIASLKHTHIASIYEFGKHEDRPYIAMEWIEGRTLKQLLNDEGALDQDRALHLFKQLANALSYAHDNGVIHRDLKPSNIIVNSLDQVTVVDFGLAWIADAPSLTATGSVIGTPLYMSPEQIQGGEIDGRSDQYSLAVILYEMLVGTPPFANDSTTALYHQQLFAPPPPITEHDPNIPLFIEEALSVALEKSAESRYQSITQFQNALSLTAQQAVNKRVATQRISQKFVWLGLILLGAFLVGAGSWYYVPAVRNFSLLPTAYQPDFDYAWTLSNGNTYQTRFADAELATAQFQYQWDAYFEEEAISDPVVVGGRVILTEWNRLYGLDWANGQISWETTLPELVTAPIVALDSWDEDILYVAPEGGGVTALTVEERQFVWQVSSAEITGSISQMATDGDSLLILTTDANKLYGLNAWNGEQEFVLPLDVGNISEIPPTATAAAIFVVDAKGGLLAIDRASHAVDWHVETEGNPTTAAVVMGNDASRGIVIGTDAGQIQAFSLLTGDEIWSVDVGSAALGVASDWWRVIVTTENGDLYAIDGTTAEILWSLDLQADAVGAPLITYDSIVVAVEGGFVRFFSADDGNENEVALIEFGEELATAPIMVGEWLFLRTSYAIFAFAP